MAISQLDTPEETIEEATARLNAEALAAKHKDKYPCQHCGYAGPIDVDINNPDELRSLAKSVLAEILKTAPRNVALVAAVREQLDRLDGKSVTPVAIDQRFSGGVTVHSTVQFVGTDNPKLLKYNDNQS